MPTTLGQRCTVFLDEASIQRFKIDSSIDSVEAGDLPLYGPSPYTSNIFVHQIVNSVDPKSDTFLRVANVADLTTLSLGRETAVGLNQTLYLSTNFTVVYDDIATASSAKLLIQQRVDNLIADWHTYNEQFLAPLTSPPDYSTISMPLTAGIVAERESEYTTAHAEYLASKVTAAEATTDATVTAAAASAANEDNVTALSESQKCSAMLGRFNSGNTAISTYRASVNNFISASVTYTNAVTTFVSVADAYRAGTADNATYDAAKSAYTSAKAIWDAAKTAMDAAVVDEVTNGQSVLEAFRSDMALTCTNKLGEVSITSQKKKDADTAAAEAATAKRAADEAQSAALLADTEAFLAYQEVCPTAERIVP
jgi:hypothetical protein